MLPTLILLCFQSPWVVKDLEATPSPQRPDEFYEWYSSLPLGDLDEDGIGDYLNEGARQINSSTDIGPLDFGTVRGGLKATGFSFHFPKNRNFGMVWGSYWSPGFVLLKKPGGWSAVGNDGTGLIVGDFKSLSFTTRIPPQPPEPGMPWQDGWDAIQPAGDVDQDGFDDFFYYGDTTRSFGYFGLIDGASMSAVWQVPFPYGQPAPIQPSNPLGWPDLDGDGAPDFIAAVTYAEETTFIYRQLIMAMSGLDGRVIWRRELPNGGGAGATGMDVDGDAVADILVMNGVFEVSALSGADGRTIWNTHIQSTTSLMPTFAYTPWFQPPVFFTEALPGQVAQTVHAHVRGTFAQSSGEDANFLVELDAQTGTPLSASEFPSDLNPWAPEVTPPFHGATPWFIGDVDRDGYAEIARPTPVISNSPPGFLGVRSNVVAGKRTLYFPSTLPIGGVHAADIDIPNAPGMSGYLLLSTSFDREQGFSPDLWRTGLVVEELFEWSQGQILTTTLDATGQGTVSFQLPNKPGLIGQRVHARFLVPDPGKPGSLWTLSSLGMGEVTPNLSPGAIQPLR